MLMETICSTGIRVSEVKYITVEALRCGKAEIALKGKIRTILLPAKLCRKLLKYCKKRKAVSGEVFLTKNGSSLSRKQIWAEMKSLCGLAGVAPSKVFPTTCGTCSPGPFSRPAGTWPSWRTCWAQLYGDHPHLPHLHRGGTRPHPGAAAAGVVGDKITILS